MIRRMNFIYHLVFLILLTLASLGNAIAQDVRAVSNSISKMDLNKPCASKFLEIHMEAETDEQAGMAILKLFFLVDSEYIKKSAATIVDHDAFGLKLGKLFQEYCEKSPSVSVKTAVQQTILALEDSLDD